MGLKSNISYNVILTLSGYIIGLVIFPYISRVLGVSNIGIISFVDNIINYFILFATLGASTIGTREIAKYKGNKDKVNTVFSNLIILYTIYTILIIIVYYFAVNYIDKLKIYKELFYIGTAKLIFSVFLIEWLYSGIENFKFITTRSLLIKFFYLISIFIFVRNSEDYIIYFVLTTLSVVVNSIINIVYSRNVVKFTLKEIDLRPYLKQSFLLGSYSILTSMYTTFNIMYLGFVTDTTQVGYYWAAIKVYTITLGFYTAFTGAIMPRMSSLLASGSIAKFNNIINNSFEILFSLSPLIIIISIIHAPQIINILSGTEFYGAVLPMQIVMPLLFVVGIAQILAMQVLIPMKRDKIIIRASFIGAAISIVSNIILVDKFGATGSAIVLVLCEVSVTIFYILVCIKKQIIFFPWSKMLKNIIASIPYAIICYISLLVFTNYEFFIVIFSCVLSLTYFIISNKYFLKNEIIHNYINGFIDKINRNN
jgi:O-antigen/teichoic acid export membrane protein